MNKVDTIAPKGKETTLAKIVNSDDLVKFVKMDDFLRVVNSEPPASFVQNHPMVAGVKFIPVDKVELMLTKMFQQWHVEILREGQMLNSIYTTVRLHFKHPITGEWTFQDGTGASPIQTDKGKSAADMAAIKNDAIMKALPAAESYALKDAAEKIGKVFGKDLNRKDAVGFTPSYGTSDVKETLEHEEAYEYAMKRIPKITQDGEFQAILETLTADQKLMAMPLIKERREELRNGYASPIPTA